MGGGPILHAWVFRAAIGGGDEHAGSGDVSGGAIRNFQYTIPVAQGKYREPVVRGVVVRPGKPGDGGAGSRVFDVYCNGVALLRSFDIFKAAGGPQRAIEKSFHGVVPNAQGKIELSFVPAVNYACVNAIEVVDDSP